MYQAKILQEMLWKILQEILWEMLQEMLWEMAWKISRDRVEGEHLFNKAMIGGNLAFGMGDGELTNQHPDWEILW